MSLRMNLRGFNMADVRQVLGSRDSDVLEQAGARISETLPQEPGQSAAKAWLRTLIMQGFPFRLDREPSSGSADGGLLTVHMETEAHALAVHCLVRALTREEHLDLAEESSCWTHAAVGALYRELSSCGFTKSTFCCVPFFSWMSGLGNGTPLFGDDFRTDWSFYTVFGNADLAAMIPVFQAAADFKRDLPAGYPEELARTTPTGLSDSGKRFVLDLVKWFGRIREAEQDALILWW